MAGAADVLTKKVGPLPMGAWLLVGAGGLFIASRRDRGPQLVTDVREVPVPVGAIASSDNAPVVITPIFRIPSIAELTGQAPGGEDAAELPPRPPVTPAPPAPSSPAGASSVGAVPGAPGVSAPGAPARGTAGSFTLNGARVHVNTAGIIDTRGSYYGQYPAALIGGAGMAVPGAPARGTAGAVTVAGKRYAVNAAGIITTPGPAFGKYPAQL